MEYSQEVVKLYKMINEKKRELEEIKNRCIDKKKEEWLKNLDIELNKTIIISGKNEYLLFDIEAYPDDYSSCYLYGRKKLKSGKWGKQNLRIYNCDKWEIKR